MRLPVPDRGAMPLCGCAGRAAPGKALTDPALRRIHVRIAAAGQMLTVTGRMEMADRKKGNLTAEMICVLDELNERQAGKSRSMSRMRAWRFTVRMSYFMKRLMDIVLSFLALVLLLPLFLVLALLIAATSPGPVFFVQVRVGRHGRHFRFYKFRSMYVDAEKRKAELLARNQSADGVIFKMKKDPRCTPVGRFLRRTSLDELPQFFNVLLGDMSLVGPRPPLPEEVSQYTLEERKRLKRLEAEENARQAVIEGEKEEELQP